MLHLYDPILEQDPKSAAYRECFLKFGRGELSQIRRHFLLPALYIPTFIVFGIFALEVDARGESGFIGCDGPRSFNSSRAQTWMRDNPYIFMHQITPRETWPFTDKVILVASGGVSLLYAFLVRNPMLGDRFRMFAHQGVVSGSQSR